MSWWQQPQIAQLIDLYQGLNPREQRLTQITSNVVILCLMAVLFIEPHWVKADAANQQSELLSAENAQFLQQLQELQNTPVTDPNQKLRDQLERLLVESEKLSLRIANLTDALVSPENMVSILEQMMTQDRQMKITALVSLPVEQIELAEGDEESRLFRHGLRVSIQSTYPGLLAYLKRLDTLKWRLYWQELEYKVTRYPKGELTFEVYTLSTKEDVLGA